MDFSAVFYPLWFLTYMYNVNLRRNQQVKKTPYTLVQEENVFHFAHVNFGSNLVRVTPLGLRFQSCSRWKTSSVQMWYQDITREKHICLTSVITSELSGKSTLMDKAPGPSCKMTHKTLLHRLKVTKLFYCMLWVLSTEKHMPDLLSGRGEAVE